MVPSKDGHSVSEKPAKGVYVLVVEDNFDTASALAKLLEHFGHSVKIAGNVGVALSMVGKDHFDVIVSDLALPDGTGYELMNELRRKTAIKGIAISGRDGVEDIERSKAAGFAHHMVKPVSVSGLDVAIRQLVK